MTVAGRCFVIQQHFWLLVFESFGLLTDWYQLLVFATVVLLYYSVFSILVVVDAPLVLLLYCTVNR